MAKIIKAHGGKRDGAGRPPSPGVRVSLYLPADLATALDPAGKKPGPAALQVLKAWAKKSRT